MPWATRTYNRAECGEVHPDPCHGHPQADANWRRRSRSSESPASSRRQTAVRMLMRYGNEALLSIDHSRLERVVCAGEVLNAPVLDWLQNTILRGRVPVIDQMWRAIQAVRSLATHTVSACCRSSPGI